MLLEHEKDGTGPKRLIRAVAFMEAGYAVQNMAEKEKSIAVRKALNTAGDALIEMGYQERRTWNRENAPTADELAPIPGDLAPGPKR